MPRKIDASARDHAVTPVVRFWSAEHDEYLKELCGMTLSYAQMVPLWDKRFPKAKKSRNALVGRAQRKGWGAGKPIKSGGKAKGMVQTRMAKAARSNAKKGRQDPALLRDEHDPGAKLERSRVLGAFDPVVIERKKGTLPCIIEQKPLTSVPTAEAERGCCMWPTNDDASEVCGAEAKIGAYCERHAEVAFRIMPTRRRNRMRDKEDREHLVRIDGSHLRGDRDPDGEWLSRQLLAMGRDHSLE